MNFQKKSSIFAFLAAISITAVLWSNSWAATLQPGQYGPLLSIQNDKFLLDNAPFRMFGFRVACALRDDALTQHLIDQLDSYASYGVYAITVFYQGCRVATYNPFSKDGTTIDPAYQARMERIIKAAAARNMVVIAGIFYQNAPFPFPNATAVENVVRTVTKSLMPYRNVIINICNENNNPGWDDTAAIYDFRQGSKIINLLKVVHSVDPERIAGGGGYAPSSNIVIGKSPEANVLLFDTAGLKDKAKDRYDQYYSAGITNKPLVDVETFGLDSGTAVPGVFPDSLKAALLAEVDAAVSRPGLSVFLHVQSWAQGTSKIHYELGGNGTASSPGIRWWFEYVKKFNPPKTTTPPPTSGTYNDSFSGSLSTAWSYHDHGGYTIGTGQELIVTIKNPAGGRILAEIWQPDGKGTRICSDRMNVLGGTSVCKVSVPGTYTARALDVGVHGSYTMTVQSAPVGSAPVGYNDTFTGQLAQAWSYKDYSNYTIGAGQQLVATVTNPPGGRIVAEIWQPDGKGTRICADRMATLGGTSICTVSVPGTYTVRALDIGVHGSYTLTIQSK